MTFNEAKSLQQFVDSVVVKATGKKMLVRLVRIHEAEKADNEDYVLLKLDDGTWYTHDEVEKV